MADLHITNGDSAANILMDSHISGDVLPWRDPMHHGPFPAGLDLADLSSVRARYLAGPSLDVGDVERDFRLRDDRLRAAASYDRVVLWFEHDLLDQLQILQLLDWFGRAELGSTHLELICIDRFDGVEPFRGIGQLNPDQMASLTSVRQPVTSDQIALATTGWAAFRSYDPRDLEGFLAGDLTPLPFLSAALHRHLEEYPWLASGLTRTERQIMSLVASGVSGPGRLFANNMDLEDAYFIGDWRTFQIISDLCVGEEPLLSCETGPFWHPPNAARGRDAFLGQQLRLTEVGETVLSGKRSAFDMVTRDYWLGGVHLRSGQRLWTWDAGAGRLAVRTD